MNLDRMFEIQGYLDRRIRYSRRLMGENLISKKVLALQVEIAELAQEVGDAWKYWKTPRPRNRERVLEELVDVLHFLLSIGLDIGIDPNERPIYAFKRMDLIDQFDAMFDMARICYIPEQWHWTLCVYLGLCDMLGFDWDKIEAAYIAKNDLNLSRQEQGY